MFLLLALVIASLLATVSACIALGLEIAKLKSDTATHQESQIALVRRVESAENEILQHSMSAQQMCSRFKVTTSLWTTGFSS